MEIPERSADQKGSRYAAAVLSAPDTKKWETTSQTPLLWRYKALEHTQQGK